MAIDFPEKKITNNLYFNLDGIKDIIEGMEGLKNLSMEVGVLRNKSRKEIARYHEYGTFRSVGKGKVAHVPARPFLRPTLEESKRNIIPEASHAIVGVAVASKHTVWIGPKRLKDWTIRILNDLGQKMAYLMKLRIMNKIPPPLKKATIKAKRRKGSPMPTTPLIDTGTMYQSIDYRVRDQGRFVKKRGLE